VGEKHFSGEVNEVLFKKKFYHGFSCWKSTFHVKMKFFAGIEMQKFLQLFPAHRQAHLCWIFLVRKHSVGNAIHLTLFSKIYWMSN
jgi:hypothetical protein